MRKGTVMALAVLGLALFSGIAQAASFDYAFVWSENRGWDSTYFSGSNSYLMISCAVVDTDSYDVYVQGIPNGSPNEQLILDSVWSAYDPYTYVRGYGSSPYPAPGPTWEKTYTFFIDENGDGDYDSGTDTSTTWDLGTVTQMPLVNSAQSSGGLHPTITWDDVDSGTQQYNLRFFEIGTDGFPKGAPLWNQAVADDDSTSYSYAYTGDLFETYDTLALRVEARDSTGLFENRSTYYTKSSVPVPSALWLLGSGLLGLIGVRRKRRAD